MARDFREFPAVNALPSPDFESPGVPYSPLESPAVLETIWRQSPSEHRGRDAWGFPIC